jgi:protein tyrosine/serine phosphatase
MGSYGRVLHRYSVTVVLALTLAVPALAQAGHSAALDNIRIGNFGTVSATYYRGAQPSGHDYADLAALGVRTVIDLQEYGDAREPQMVEQAGMKYVRIQMTTRIIPTAAQIAQFLSIVNDPKSAPVYVHCAGGRHRTGVMTAIYRMATEGWDASRAFAEMKKYRFGADYLHPEFKKFVLAYQPLPGIVSPTVSRAAATN